MANRYANLVGSNKIKDEYSKINTGFDAVQTDIDSISADLSAHKADAIAHLSQAEHNKLSSIEEGAQVNQNAFAKVNGVEADDPSDELTIEGGTGIAVTQNPLEKKVTITATGTATPGPHGSAHLEFGADPIPLATTTEGGLMSASDKAKLDGATSAATPNTIVQRDPAGRFKSAAPVAADDVARKAEVDGKVSKSGDTMTGLLTALGGIDLEVSSVPTGKAGRMHASAITKQIYYHDGTDWREVWHGGNNLVSFTNPGYVKLANGFLLQFGFVTDVPSLTPTPVTFGIAFPNYIIGVWPSPNQTAPTKVSFFNISLSGAVVMHDDPNTITLTYLAVGW